MVIQHFQGVIEGCAVTIPSAVQVNTSHLGQGIAAHLKLPEQLVATGFPFRQSLQQALGPVPWPLVEGLP